MDEKIPQQSASAFGGGCDGAAAAVAAAAVVAQQKRLFGRWPESLVERTCNFRSGGWLVGWAACRPQLHREEVREGAGATRK